MAKQNTEPRTEYVVRRIRAQGYADYLTPCGGWSSNPDLARVFPTDGAARIALRKRTGEIVARHVF